MKPSLKDLVEYHEKKSLKLARQPDHHKSLWHIDAAKLLRKMGEVCKTDAIRHGAFGPVRSVKE